MIFWNSQQTKEELKKGEPNLLSNLDRQVFGGELIYSMNSKNRDGLLHPMSLYSAALSDDGKKILAYFSMTIVTERYYRALLEGKTKEEDFEPWTYESKETPLLFLRNLVIDDRRATPYIFRYAVKELLDVCAHNDIYLHRAFTIATHWITKKILKNYKFTEVGTYEGKYPILMGSRDSSPVFNSFLKRY